MMNAQHQPLPSLPEEVIAEFRIMALEIHHAKNHKVHFLSCGYNECVTRLKLLMAVGTWR